MVQWSPLLGLYRGSDDEAEAAARNVAENYTVIEQACSVPVNRAPKA
jgi:hypothetical protein